MYLELDMTQGYRLRCWTRFHTEASTLWPALLPSGGGGRVGLGGLRVSLQGLGAEGLQACQSGQRVPASLSWMGLGLGWKGEVELLELEPQRRVVTELLGPGFTRWTHTLLLQPSSDGVRCLDQIDFTPAGLHRWVARGVLEQALASHRALARTFPSDEKATAVAILRHLNPDEEQADAPV